MICNCFTKKLVCSIMVGLMALSGLVGCRTQHDYKAEADEKVYKIIEQKWRKEFGSQVNFKISDTEPSPNDIQIEKAIPPSGVLGLPQAVALATAHNRLYQLEKELLYTTALDLNLMRHNFETIYYGRPKSTYAKAEGINYVSVGTGIEPRFNPARAAQDIPVDPCGVLDGDEFRIDNGFGFNQLLTDGTMIGANVVLSWGRILTGALKGESLISILAFEVAKPFLRGSDRKVVMEGLTQAERDTLYQVRSFNRFRKTFVVGVITQYYWVLQNYDAVENAHQYYKTLDEMYGPAEKLVNAGRLFRLELDRIRQEKLEAWDIYVQAQKGYKQALDEFKFWQLSLPANVEFQLDVNELEVLRSVVQSNPEFSEAEAIETALARRLDLVNSADAIIDAKRKVYVAADSLRAQLDLGVSTNIPLQDLSSSNVKAFQDLLLSRLQVDLPFDRDFEQNIYRKTLITLSQRQREYEEMSDWVTLEVRQAYRDLTEAAERYRVQSEGVALARKRLKNTSLLLQYGRASSRRVLNAHDGLFDSKNAATEALVNYAVATLNFYRDTGVLQVRPDGMWEKESAQENKTKDQRPQTKDHSPTAKVLLPES